MNTEIVFSPETIAAFALMAVLGIAVPVAAVLVWRFGLKKGTLKATFIGAGMFFVFVSVLEKLLHMVMLPLVSGNIVLYVLYGALAAGIFEETARFLSFRFLLKRELSAENAVSYGIGHGGCECVLMLGITAVSILAMAASVNAAGSAELIAGMSAGNETIAAQLEQQLLGYSHTTLPGAFIAVFERVVAMALHVSLSVFVMEAVMVKGRMWLYPAAVLIHALMDVPAVLYQVGAIPIVVCELMMAAFTAVWAVIAVKRYKFLSRTKSKA